MAPKAKQNKPDTAGAGKNKQEAKSKSGETSQGMSDMEMLVQERKLYLQEENKTLSEHLETYMGRVEHFLQENKFLEREAQQNRDEGNAYLSYLARHNQKCQDLIITLNEQNHSDLSGVWAQKEKLISEYTEKEQELRGSLTDVETKFTRLSEEVEDLKLFQDPAKQMNKIKELEKELLATKVQQADEMHKIKSRFLQAKADYEKDCGEKMQDLSRRAEEAAVNSLIHYIKEVKAENWRLRQELLELIDYSKSLKETKIQLMEQQEQLLREIQYVQDMARRRQWLHQPRARHSPGQTCSCHSPFTGVH
ncbi:CC166 protein, partial [Turnix velox]|nr:CC166 protein [Turnix velox]